MLDFRSDTIVLPTNDMKTAMFNAGVGHEGWDEDENITALEDKFIEMTGKEAAVFLPTMSVANILVSLAICERTDEIIVEYYSHTFQHAASAFPALAGIQPHPIIAENRRFLTLSDLLPHIRTNRKFPITKLIIEENTHSIYGGTVIPIDTCREIYLYAKGYDIKVHLDGARLLYAQAATNITVKEYAKWCDTLGICLTKGLGCPYGAVLCGPDSVIQRVRYYKKVMGLNLHYVGYFAAAALYALDNNVDRLNEDIANTRYFAEKIRKLNTVTRLNTADTNIVHFVPLSRSSDSLISELKKYDISAMNYYSDYVRFVFNRTIRHDDAEYLYNIIERILGD